MLCPHACPAYLEAHQRWPPFAFELAALVPPIQTQHATASDGSDRLYSFDTTNGENAVTPTEVEMEYEKRWKAMSHAEKVSRSAAMLAWTRQQIARRIRDADPNLSDEEVKWHVALKLYEREPEVVKLIQEQLSSVSR